MNKRGISPLIASVLLIAFSITSFLIISTWVQRSVVEPGLEEGTSKIAGVLECGNARVKVKDAKLINGDIELEVSNEGDKDVLSYYAKFDGAIDSDIVNVAQKLDILETKKNTVSLSKVTGAISQIEVFPVIEQGRCPTGLVYKIKENDYTHFLDPSLVAAYDFEGNKAEDVSGNGNTGSLQGEVDCDGQGKKGRGCRFDGVDDGINLRTPDALNKNIKDFSIEAWGKLEIDVSGYMGTNYELFNNEDFESHGYLFRIQGDSSFRAIYLRTNFGGQEDPKYSVVGTGSQIYPNDQGWHHLVATKEGTVGKLYLDGEEVKSGTLEDPADSGSSSFIGGKGQYFRGKLDSVAFYNRALTGEEVKEHAEL